MNAVVVIVVIVLAAGLMVFWVQQGKQKKTSQQVSTNEVRVPPAEIQLPAAEMQVSAPSIDVPPVATRIPAEDVVMPPAAAPVCDAQPGIRAFMKGRYEEAFALLEPAAQEGNLRAQQFLAKMYYAGNGVPADREKYIYWMTRAAENGDRPSRIKVKKIKSGRA